MRLVVVPIEDTAVAYISVREHRERGTRIGQKAHYVLPVAPGDQFAQDLLEAISIVEYSGWSHRHQLAARLRTAFGIDQEDDS